MEVLDEVKLTADESDEIREKLVELAYLQTKRLEGDDQADDLIEHVTAQILAIAGTKSQAVKERLNQKVHAFISYAFDALFAALA